VKLLLLANSSWICCFQTKQKVSHLPFFSIILCFIFERILSSILDIGRNRPKRERETRSKRLFWYFLASTLSHQLGDIVILVFILLILQSVRLASKLASSLVVIFCAHPVFQHSSTPFLLSFTAALL